MSGIITDEFPRMQNNVKEILQKNESKISFNVDGWSTKNFDSYYGITAHFINEDWISISLAIDLVQSQGIHAGK